MSDKGDGSRAGPASATPDDPDELWDRLRRVRSEAGTLAAENNGLVAKARWLETALSDAGASGETGHMGELPRRMTRAIESVQHVAEELVGRAKRRAAFIGEESDRHATVVVATAEAAATAILRRAAAEAVATVNEGKTGAEAVAGAARAHGDRILGDLGGKSDALEERIRRLRRDYSARRAAYDAVERTLSALRDALHSAIGERGPRSVPVSEVRQAGPLGGSVPADQASGRRERNRALMDRPRAASGPG